MHSFNGIVVGEGLGLTPFPTIRLRQTTLFSGQKDIVHTVQIAPLPKQQYCRVRVLQNKDRPIASMEYLTLPIKWLVNVTKQRQPTRTAAFEENCFVYRKFPKHLQPDNTLCNDKYESNVDYWEEDRVIDPPYFFDEVGQQDVRYVEIREDEVKGGWSLFATENIPKDTVVSHYIVENKLQPSDGDLREFVDGGTYAVQTARDGYIGDVCEDSVPPKTKRGVSFWAHFANEPSMDQQPNTHLVAEYDSETLNYLAVFSLVSDRRIRTGEEILWCYGSDYARSYPTPCADVTE